jgi:hypothetical protein
MRSRPRPIRSQVIVLLTLHLPATTIVFLRRRSSTRPQRWPSCKMQLLSLCHKTPPRKRISVLTAQQRADLPTSLRVHDSEAGSVAVRPD